MNRELKRIYDMTIKDENNNSVWIVFHQVYKEDYGYMGMADYPTLQPTNECRISAIHFDSHSKASTEYAGDSSGSFISKIMDIDMARKIWYNLDQGMNYNRLVKAMDKNDLLRKIDGRYINSSTN